MRNKLTIKTLFFITVLSSVSSSINTTWIKAMRICENNDERPTKTMDIVETDTWIGEAKYKLQWGEVFLRVEAVHRNDTCISTAESICSNSTVDCEFCDVSNLSFQSALKKIRHLTPNKKYIVAAFTNIAEREREDFFTEITEPQLCLMKTSNSTPRFDFCSQKHYDGCQKTGEFSNLKITLEARINSNANALKMRRGQLLLFALFLLGGTSLL